MNDFLTIISLDSDPDADQIRNLVSVAYDSINLTNETIRQDVFLVDADLYIQSQIPEWQNLEGVDRKRLEILVKKQCAVNILTAYARVRRQSAEDLSEDNDQLTPAQAIKRYEDDIATGIEDLNPTQQTGRYITAAVVV